MCLVLAKQEQPAPWNLKKTFIKTLVWLCRWKRLVPVWASALENCRWQCESWLWWETEHKALHGVDCLCVITLLLGIKCNRTLINPCLSSAFFSSTKRQLLSLLCVIWNDGVSEIDLVILRSRFCFVFVFCLSRWAPVSYGPIEQWAGKIAGTP